MSFRKPIRRDPVDLVIASTLKAWVERSPQPPRSRVLLLQAAGAEQEHKLFRTVTRAVLRGLLLGLTAIPDALIGEPVFESYRRDESRYARGTGPANLNLMQISFFYSHTPRLGLFSMVF